MININGLIPLGLYMGSTIATHYGNASENPFAVISHAIYRAVTEPTRLTVQDKKHLSKALGSALFLSYLISSWYTNVSNKKQFQQHLETLKSHIDHLEQILSHQQSAK